MSYSGENRMMQPYDPSFPLLNSIGSSVVCGPCFLQYSYQAPRVLDFQGFPHSESTRISQFWLDVSGYWKFVNFKGETYLRCTNSPVWFYQFGNSIPGPMCYHHSVEVEKVYGLFLRSSDITNNWIYQGYAKKYFPHHSCLVCFSADEFDRNTKILPLPLNEDAMDTSVLYQGQANTQPPPGFQEGDLMDFTESVENLHENQTNQNHKSSSVCGPPGFINTQKEAVTDSTTIDSIFSSQSSCQRHSNTSCHTETPPQHVLQQAFHKESISDGTNPCCSPDNQDTRAFSPEQSHVSTPSSDINRNVGHVNCEDRNTCLTTDSPKRETPAVISSTRREDSLEKNNTNQINVTITNHTQPNVSATTHFESKTLDTVCNTHNENPVNGLLVLQVHAPHDIKANTGIKENSGSSTSEHIKDSTLPLNHNELKLLPKVDLNQIENQMAKCGIEPEDLKNNLSTAETLPLSVGSKLLSNNDESNKKESSNMLNSNSPHKPSSNLSSKPAINNGIKGSAQSADSRIKEDCRSSHSSTKSSGSATVSGKEVRQNVIVPTAQNTEKAFKSLQVKYRELYKKLPNCELGPPLDSENTIYKLFDLTVLVQDKVNKKAKPCNLIFDTKMSAKKILVQAGAGFGKTVLCHMFAYRWACSPPENSYFKLCVFLPLSFMENETDVTDLIITACRSVLDQSDYGAELISKALSANSAKILLFLDGYDSLPENLQKKVYFFLDSSSVFHNASIIMTTRPVEPDCEILKLFDKHVFIHGLSEKYIEKLLISNKTEFQTKQCFLDNFKHKKLDFLYELSPYFSAYIVKIFNRQPSILTKCKTLYTLLRIIFYNIVLEDSTIDPSIPSVNNILDLFQLLGNLFFYALTVSKHSFTENELRDCVGEQLKHLVRWNIVYKKTRQSGDKSVMFGTSRILMIFFATMYLRIQWKTMPSDMERWKFLQTTFCAGCCTGDYVTEENGCLDYVGVVPEIVLKIEKQQSLDQATFEMYYDVEAVEYSRAFESVNILTRIRGKYLGRYGFRVRSDENQDFLNTFGSVIDNMSVDNCLVDYRFYENVYENRRFMKMEIESTSAMLHTIVLSAKYNKVIDRLYIDFMYSEFRDLFNTIRNLLMIFAKDLVLPEALKRDSLSTFICSLTPQMYEIQDNHNVNITCANGNSRAHTPVESVTSFNIYTNQETAKKTCRVLEEEFFPDSLIPHVQNYSVDFWKIKSKMPGMLKRYDKDEHSRVTLYLF